MIMKESHFLNETLLFLQDRSLDFHALCALYAVTGTYFNSELVFSISFLCGNLGIHYIYLPFPSNGFACCVTSTFLHVYLCSRFITGKSAAVI